MKGFDFSKLKKLKDVNAFIERLKQRRAELDKIKFERRKKALLEQPVPQVWLERAAEDCGDDDNDDVMKECFDDARAFVEMDLYVVMRQEEIMCKRKKCWYIKNKGRTSEHAFNYTHALRPHKFYCDKCAEFHGSTYVGDEEVEHFFPQFKVYMEQRQQKVKRQKI